MLGTIGITITKPLLHDALWLACLLCGGVLAVAVSRGVHKVYPFLLGFAACCGVRNAIHLAALFHRQQLGLSRSAALDLWFYGGWSCYALESLFVILTIYNVYREAMRPMAGLHKLGKIVFRWVTAVCLTLSAMVAFAPQAQGSRLFSIIVGQMQRGVSVLTICLLLFVTFAIKPLGLTFRSRLFGVSLGMGIFATLSLVLSGWSSTTQSMNVYSGYYLMIALSPCVASIVWLTWFLLPEPQRRLITLPTTSPFFHWNRISEALGDEPGRVVISGFTPEMLAPAELALLAPDEASLAEQAPASLPQPAPQPVPRLARSAASPHSESAPRALIPTTSH